MQLGECITAKATPEDKPALAKWVAVEISAAPLLAGVVTVDASKREELDEASAAIFTRLITQDCADQARPLLHGDPRIGFRAAGGSFMRLAIRELLASPGINAAIVRSYLSRINQADFAALAKP